MAITLSFSILAAPTSAMLSLALVASSPVRQFASRISQISHRHTDSDKQHTNVETGRTDSSHHKCACGDPLKASISPPLTNGTCYEASAGSETAWSSRCLLSKCQISQLISRFINLSICKIDQYINIDSLWRLIRSYRSVINCLNRSIFYI